MTKRRYGDRDWKLGESVKEPASTGPETIIPHVTLDDGTGTILGTAASPLTVVGNVASGATDSGNPVKVGGKYNSAGIALTDGQRGDLQLGAAGQLLVRSAPYTQLGYQQILSATLASSTALTVPSGATLATVQNNSTGVCRWRPDGSTTAPTATTGQTIAAGATLTLDDGATGLAAARFIIGSGTVILDICYFS